MADFATLTDLSTRNRALRGQEIVVAQTWLTDASEVLRVKIPDIDDRCTASASYSRLVTATVASAVLRRLIGVYDLNDPEAARRPYFFNTELDDLRASAGAAGRVSSVALVLPYADELVC